MSSDAFIADMFRDNGDTGVTSVYYRRIDGKLVKIVEDITISEVKDGEY